MLGTVCGGADAADEFQRIQLSSACEICMFSYGTIQFALASTRTKETLRPNT